MNIDRDDAVRIANEFLRDEELTRYGYTPVADRQNVDVVGGGYIVPWATEAYFASGQMSDNVAGNIPLYVDGELGTCRYLSGEEFIAYVRRQASGLD